MRKLTLTSVIGLTLSLATPVMAESKTYTDVGEILRDEISLGLSNGGMAFSVRSQGLATISTSPSALLEVRYLSLGVTQGEAEFTADVICSF